ncbi:MULTISPECIES: hypothetical protein [unclassified Aurantimonas]|uniref:hypothetical protein n=1 Tax=unclassified Aurantimonas TaxID=2638230 RepID=UPI002E17433B|nr:MULTISPECIES: hypothetical protein [unclassified Aurantimonas]MEC5291584.1 hypothetical protein [Aurantimonas sp. C2-3-R2]MEC5412668.1 hypothetical protein [Aurantimonas sp. C2-4-R8]
MSNIVEQDVEDGVSEIEDGAGVSNDTELPATADTSTATDDNTSEGEETLSLIRDAVTEKETPAEASSAESEEAGQETGEDATSEQDNENYSDVPFNKHPRFREVLGKLKTAETDAQRYQNVQTFLDEQGLGAEETAELLTIGGMMKRDPAKAWERIKPTIQKLLVAAGEILPEDLQQRVQNGEMSRDAAMDVSRSRMQVQSTERNQSFEQQRAQSRQQQERANTITSTVTSWEQDRRTKDPNFDAKMPALQKEIAWLHATEGRPDTPEGVKAQLKKAYDAVSPAPAQTAPPARRQAVTPVRGGQVAGNTRPEPQSTLDIIRAARNRA